MEQQKERHITYPDGTKLKVLPYPETVPKTRCPGCGAKAGELHEPGCEFEECPKCRDLLSHCDCLEPTQLEHLLGNLIEDI